MSNAIARLDRELGGQLFDCASFAAATPAVLAMLSGALGPAAAGSS